MIHLTTTCPDLATARSIAKAALEARLAACVNVTEGIKSLYHWDGAVQEDEEVQAQFKTRAGCLDDLCDLIADLHPYDLPVITWEQVSTTTAANGWLHRETNGDPSKA